MLNRTLSGANLSTFFQYFAFSGTLFLVAFGVQQLAGASALPAGLVLLPATVLIAVGSAPSGRITDAWGPVFQMRLGPAVFVPGAVLLALAGIEGTVVDGDVSGAGAFLGAGMFANAVIGATLVSRFRIASDRLLAGHGADPHPSLPPFTLPTVRESGIAQVSAYRPGRPGAIRAVQSARSRMLRRFMVRT